MSRPALALAIALAGCSSPVDPNQVEFTSDTYTLQPGDEKYFCYTTNLPADRDVVITKLTPTYGVGTHHILFSETLAAEPAGFSECPVLSRTTWLPLYAGGKDSGPLAMPAGAGVKPLARHQQLVMQLHLQNATTVPISAKTSMRITLADAKPDVIAAGIFGLDDRKLDIPANTSAALNEMSCQMDRDLDVFAVLGHMHRHGVHLEVSRGKNAGDEILYQEKWNFDVQPVTPVSLKVHSGDQIFLRCTHENDTGTPIMYGESSNAEMCALVMYYAPGTPVDGCVHQ